MVNTLVVIGHHEREALFGNYLQKIMAGDKSLLFYSVKQNYDNTKKVPCGAESRVFREIEKVVDVHKPHITIDVHVGEGDICWWKIELFTFWEYDKLTSLNKFSTNFFPVLNSGIYVPKDYPPKRKFLFMQKKFHYISLERYLTVQENFPPFTRSLPFTAEIIRHISNLYKD